MKKISKKALYESIMHTVDKTVRKALNEAYTVNHGYAPNEGNGMVGGEYGSRDGDAVAHIDIFSVFAEVLADADDSLFEKLFDIESDCENFPVYGELHAFYDRSVGIDDTEYELTDVFEDDVISRVNEIIAELNNFYEISIDERDAIITSVNNILEKLTVADFDWDDEY